jgi:signal transduction histidine kinase
MGLLFIGVAAVDYWTGYELWFSIFYLAFIGWATWQRGPLVGVVVAAASVAFSLVGDLASGARYGSPLVPWWNVLISLSFYLAMVLVLQRLRATQRGLERQVEERTAALRQEMAERTRLEQALLGVSEREQQRIGHELHDSLCQHLTGTAFAAQVLSGRLSAAERAEAKVADQLVTMVEEGIELSRSLARGLAPLELDGEGLVEALHELAATTSATSPNGLVCQVQVDVKGALRVNRSASATHLFRIAQEAVRNAVKHSAAKRIIIRLADGGEGVSLIVEDDGVGQPEGWPRREGMGLPIMRYRADMARAELAIEGLNPGTRVAVRTRSAEEEQRLRSETPGRSQTKQPVY